eukprot:GHVQ01029791.1.p1 GENE.GHVQ01029791.1~~GHVQ01029791.1.p1  ORF type:complete len:1162 (+),score=150.07 GHVQ01029791.1:128-3487(+)
MGTVHPFLTLTFSSLAAYALLLSTSFPCFASQVAPGSNHTATVCRTFQVEKYASLVAMMTDPTIGSETTLLQIDEAFVNEVFTRSDGSERVHEKYLYNVAMTLLRRFTEAWSELFPTEPNPIMLHINGQGQTFPMTFPDVIEKVDACRLFAFHRDSGFYVELFLGTLLDMREKWLEARRIRWQKPVSINFTREAALFSILTRRQESDWIWLEYERETKEGDASQERQGLWAKSFSLDDGGVEVNEELKQWSDMLVASAMNFVADAFPRPTASLTGLVDLKVVICEDEERFFQNRLRRVLRMCRGLSLPAITFPRLAVDFARTVFGAERAGRLIPMDVISGRLMSGPIETLLHVLLEETLDFDIDRRDYQHGSKVYPVCRISPCTQFREMIEGGTQTEWAKVVEGLVEVGAGIEECSKMSLKARNVMVAAEIARKAASKREPALDLQSTTEGRQMVTGMAHVLQEAEWNSNQYHNLLERMVETLQRGSQVRYEYLVTDQPLKSMEARATVLQKGDEGAEKWETCDFSKLLINESVDVFFSCTKMEGPVMQEKDKNPHSDQPGADEPPITIAAAYNHTTSSNDTAPIDTPASTHTAQAATICRTLQVQKYASLVAMMADPTIGSESKLLQMDEAFIDEVFTRPDGSERVYEKYLYTIFIHFLKKFRVTWSEMFPTEESNLLSALNGEPFEGPKLGACITAALDQDTGGKVEGLLGTLLDMRAKWLDAKRIRWQMPSNSSSTREAALFSIVTRRQVGEWWWMSLKTRREAQAGEPVLAMNKSQWLWMSEAKKSPEDNPFEQSDNICAAAVHQWGSKFSELCLKFLAQIGIDIGVADGNGQSQVMGDDQFFENGLRLILHSCHDLCISGSATSGLPRLSIEFAKTVFGNVKAAKLIPMDVTSGRFLTGPMATLLHVLLYETSIVPLNYVDHQPASKVYPVCATRACSAFSEMMEKGAHADWDEVVAGLVEIGVAIEECFTNSSTSIDVDVSILVNAAKARVAASRREPALCLQSTTQGGQMVTGMAHVLQKVKWDSNQYDSWLERIVEALQRGSLVRYEYPVTVYGQPVAGDRLPRLPRRRAVVLHKGDQGAEKWKTHDFSQPLKNESVDIFFCSTKMEGPLM